MATAINGSNIVLYEYEATSEYFFNGGTSQGTILGSTYYELSRTQVVSSSANFTKTGAGTIATFITDPADPAQTTIPAGTWTFSTYASILTSYAGATFKFELYTYNGTSLSALIATSATTALTSLSSTLYTTTMSVPVTSISATDRIVIKIIYAGTTTNQITIYTQSSNPLSVATTFALGTPFGASTNCTFDTSVDQVEITTLASGSYKEYIGSQINWSISADGLVALSGYSYLALLSKMQNIETIAVKFSIDNDNGTGSGTLGYSIFTGNANITSLSISGPMENASTYSVSLQGTGAYSITGTTVIDGGTTISTSSVTSDSSIAAGGEYTLTFTNAIGSTCISVTRGGLEVRSIITTGVPTGEDVKFNTITGVLTFARALESDEFVRATFK